MHELLPHHPNTRSSSRTHGVQERNYLSHLALLSVSISRACPTAGRNGRRSCYRTELIGSAVRCLGEIPRILRIICHVELRGESFFLRTEEEELRILAEMSMREIAEENAVVD